MSMYVTGPPGLSGLTNKTCRTGCLVLPSWIPRVSTVSIGKSVLSRFSVKQVTGGLHDQTGPWNS